MNRCLAIVFALVALCPTVVGAQPLARQTDLFPRDTPLLTDKLPPRPAELQFTKLRLTNKLSCETFRPRQLIAPAALIAVGWFGTQNSWMKGINSDIRYELGRMRGGNYIHVDDYLQYATAAGYFGLGFIPGTRPHHNFKQRLLAGATAYAIMAVIVNPAKRIARYPRPDSGAPTSFPGHTATAFTGAELMRLEYGNYVGLAGYCVATGVAFLRMYNERHWLNDVLAGAGIGILSARAAYWLLPLERRLFRMKETGAQYSLVPYMSVDRTAGLTCSIVF